MKLKLSVLLLLSITLPLFAQPGKGQRGGRSNQQITLPTEPLSTLEENSLFLMREEEKLARDVYQTLFEQWNLSIFSNISASEQRHTDRIKYLLDRYELQDPFIDQRGVFKDAHLQELYDALVAQGSVSQLDALKVGATIEDLDIHDLVTLLPQVDNKDIQQVYENLAKGSRNHLRAFYGMIVESGGTYTAQYITQEAFDEIVNTPMEQGPADGSKGKGNRGRNSRQDQQACEKTSPGYKTIRVSNYPNPANPTTTIVYQLDSPGEVEVSIFNNVGQLVRNAVLGSQSAGEGRYIWDGADAAGHSVSSGIYYCRIHSNGAVAMHRLLLMR